jgi:ParB family chromosome partitioning protein
VRQAERISLEYGKGNKSPSKDREKRPEQERQKNPELSRIQESLISRLGTKVKIRGTETSGTIEIEYYSMEDLERLIEIIGSSKP